MASPFWVPASNTPTGAVLTLLGVWGVGHLPGRALANLFGAGLVDLMNFITGHLALLAYGTAFLVEAAHWALLAFRGLHIDTARTITGS